MILTDQDRPAVWIWLLDNERIQIAHAPHSSAAVRGILTANHWWRWRTSSFPLEVVTSSPLASERSRIGVHGVYDGRIHDAETIPILLSITPRRRYQVFLV